MADALDVTIVLPYGNCIPNTVTISNHVLDASNDSIGMKFQSRTSDAITHLGYRYGARTGTPPTYKISLQGLDLTTGNPDGTIKGGGSPASATFTPPADTSQDGTYQWVALTNSYTPSIEEILTVVIEYDSGTIDASNNGSFTYEIRYFDTLFSGMPVAMRETAGSWAETFYKPVLSYRTASRRYGFVYESTEGTSFNTSGHRRACRFTLPADWGDTFKIQGLHFFGGSTGGGTYKVGVWEGTATTHDEITIDKEEQRSVAAGAMCVPFAAQPTLSFGTEYYIGLEATGGFIQLHGTQLSEANDRLATVLGTNAGWSSFNGSTWTDDDTIVPWIGIQLADITEPAGGGGGGGVKLAGAGGGLVG